VSSAETTPKDPPEEVSPEVALLQRPLVRLAMVGVVIAILWSAGTATGVVESLTQERIRALVEAAGLWGAIVYTAAFILGQMMHLPGLLFVAAGTFAWGAALGGVIASVAATVAVVVNFAMVRTVGGGALVELRRPVIARIIFSLHRRPKLTMIVTRCLFMTSPLLSTLLALSGVRHRDHALASAVGMLVPIFAWAFVFDAALR
jgi:uncharacterized membrane protein YdjX (TVP38/TMEM64 family)